MRIEKWYLDCVTSSGAGMIGYAAQLGLGPLMVRMMEAMQWRAGEPAIPSPPALGGDLPAVSADGIDWTCPRLRTNGRWQPLVAALPARILHEDPAGRLEWDCFCPAARATVNLAGQRYEGSGYAERLVMTLPAARLPLRELHWGRFIAGAQSCVWLRWLGPADRSWCFHNGRPVTALAPDPRQLDWDGHRLQLAGGTVLRSGRIGDSVLQGARWLRPVLPAAVLNLVETKWCSDGLLTAADGTQHRGWAIHEIVRFP